VEVVGDPFDMYAPGAVRHPFRPLLRRWFTASVVRQCANAAGACYVTERVLQQRYPCPAGEFAASDVILNGIPARSGDPSCTRQNGTPLRLITIASLSHPYKGIDVLLRAISKCSRAGQPVTLTVIGDGGFRCELEQLSARLGLSGSVFFVGEVPSGLPVLEHLAAHDVFVLPSRAEGLPRSLVEAMACGLPCIGSDAGGIVELLAPEFVVARGDVSALAGKIQDLRKDPLLRTAAGTQNRLRATCFTEETLKARRAAFFLHLSSVTEMSTDQWPYPSGTGRTRSVSITISE
jgi:phosphatidylinositol alpha-1,6-mannosyltransferase